MRIAWLLLGLAAAWLTGCRTPDPLGPAMRGEIHPGMSLPEVRQSLGNPTYHEQARSGRSVEVYEALQTIFGSYGIRDREEALEIRQFSVRYNPENRVEQTLYHRGVLEGWTMLYSRSLGPEIDPAKLAQVRVGATTRTELERWFGPASIARLEPDGGVRCEWIYDYVEVGTAVMPARTFRAVEVLLDDIGVVTASRATDRTFPTWRR